MATGQLPLAQSLLAGFSLATARAEPERRSVLTADAVVAEARGDPEGAAALYEQAANGWEASGNALERGQALLGLGRCLGRLGRPEAGSRLREARAVLGDLGCRQLVAETDGWLQQDTAQTGWGAAGGRAP